MPENQCLMGLYLHPDKRKKEEKKNEKKKKKEEQIKNISLNL